ncbi:31368_t:CDS:2, partial [Gigaspora margarita]
ETGPPSSIGITSVGTSFTRTSSVPTAPPPAIVTLQPPQPQALPIPQTNTTVTKPVVIISSPPGGITPYITMTVTDNGITTSPTASNTGELNGISPQTIILAASVLSSVGIITILGVIALCWFRRGEKRKFTRNEVSQIHDDQVILRRSRMGNFDGSIDQNDDFVTYRPSDPDDEHLPSYAEAIVIGRASTELIY